jgi:CDP-glucose 4,6-dehydratase
VVEGIRARWPGELAIRAAAPGAAATEAPALRLDSSRARERLGWAPPLDLAAGLDATVSWHDQVRAGGDARAVTLTQIEDAS